MLADGWNGPDSVRRWVVRVSVGGCASCAALGSGRTQVLATRTAQETINFNNDSGPTGNGDDAETEKGDHVPGNDNSAWAASHGGSVLLLIVLVAGGYDKEALYWCNVSNFGEDGYKLVDIKASPTNKELPHKPDHR
jgi:hypothetical protein